jgi:hypothetical protein
MWKTIYKKIASLFIKQKEPQVQKPNKSYKIKAIKEQIKQR